MDQTAASARLLLMEPSVRLDQRGACSTAAGSCQRRGHDCSKQFKCPVRIASEMSAFSESAILRSSVEGEESHDTRPVDIASRNGADDEKAGGHTESHVR